jgi:O-antigen ligase
MSLFAISYYTFVPLNKKIKFFFISIIISFITIFFYIAPESKQRLVNNLRSSTANFSALPQVHRDHYMTGLNMFRDNYLFGQGPKMFRVSCKNEKFIYGPHGCSTHPHSIVIQFLAELGMVGLSFLMFFYYCIFKNIVNYIFTKKNKNFYVFLLSINMLINFFPLLPYGNFFNNWLSMCSWFCIPIFMFLNNIKIK